MIGLFVILCWYLFLCYVRWKHARHYGEPVKLLNRADLKEAWEHLEFCSYPRIVKVLSLLPFVLGAALAAWEMTWK